MTITKSYWYVPNLNEPTKFEKMELHGIDPQFRLYEMREDYDDELSLFVQIEDDNTTQTAQLVVDMMGHWTVNTEFVLRIQWGWTPECAVACVAGAFSGFEQYGLENN